MTYNDGMRLLLKRYLHWCNVLFCFVQNDIIVASTNPELSSGFHPDCGAIGALVCMWVQLIDYNLFYLFNIKLHMCCYVLFVFVYCF